jgi:hypothetical protein
MATPEDSHLLNALVRMVVPLRREFGRQLDVQHFLHDLAYARDIIDLALSSKDTRLVEYARYVETRRFGPRIAQAGPSSAPAADPPAAPIPAAPAAAPAKPTAEELRARVMKKYTDGLR